MDVSGLPQFADLQRHYEDAMARHAASEKAMPRQLDPLDACLIRDRKDLDLPKFVRAGLERIANGQVAVVTLAGGQATRLGADVPKALYPLETGHDDLCNLLDIQAAQLRRVNHMASKTKPNNAKGVHWIILASDSNASEYEEYIEDHPALAALNPRVIRQCSIPAFDKRGNPVPDCRTASKLVMSPNGNGGFFEAIRPMLDNELKDVLGFHVYCVDNILVRVADPVFIGLCFEEGVECGVKTVERAAFNEKVGVFAMDPANKRVIPVEYNELSLFEVARTDPEGNYVYRWANIANHYFSMDFMKRVCALDLPYHVATKELKSYPNPTDKNHLVKVSGVKLERFIFDVIPEASEKFIALKVSRQEEFAPLKNNDSTGVDCPTSCLADLVRLHTSWIEAVGVTIDQVPQRVRSAVGVIHPAMSYAGEGLKDLRLAQLRFASSSGI